MCAELYEDCHVGWLAGSGSWMALLCPLVVRRDIFLSSSVACVLRPATSYFDSISDSKYKFNLEHLNESSTGFYSLKHMHTVFDVDL